MSLSAGSLLAMMAATMYLRVTDQQELKVPNGKMWRDRHNKLH